MTLTPEQLSLLESHGWEVLDDATAKRIEERTDLDSKLSRRARRDRFQLTLLEDDSGKS